jgi:hypothetical protein
MSVKLLNDRGAHAADGIDFGLMNEPLLRCRAKLCKFAGARFAAADPPQRVTTLFPL